MNQQLTKDPARVIGIIRRLETELTDLDSLILATPTGTVREELSSAAILIKGAVDNHLKNVV